MRGAGAGGGAVGEPQPSERVRRHPGPQPRWVGTLNERRLTGSLPLATLPGFFLPMETGENSSCTVSSVSEGHSARPPRQHAQGTFRTIIPLLACEKLPPSARALEAEQPNGPWCGSCGPLWAAAYGSGYEHASDPSLLLSGFGGITRAGVSGTLDPVRSCGRSRALLPSRSLMLGVRCSPTGYKGHDSASPACSWHACVCEGGLES